MRRLTSIGVALLVLAIGAGTSTASPPSTAGLLANPLSLNFGTTTVDNTVIKPVKLVNRTSSTLYYTTATWPNFSNPSLSWPYGFWDVDPWWPANESPFRCWTIDPKSTCTEYFAFTPPAAGSYTATFSISYSTSPDDAWPGYCGEYGTCYTSNEVAMRGRGIAATG